MMNWKFYYLFRQAVGLPVKQMVDIQSYPAISPHIYSGKSQKQEVLRFEISVTDLPLVHVENRWKHLLHHNRRIFFSELTNFDNSIEQLTSCTKLHGQVDVLSIFLEFKKHGRKCNTPQLALQN